MELTLSSSSAQETEAIAGRLASRLGEGDVVTVSGELGTGKTTFVRGACRALGVAAPVTSPTYPVPTTATFMPATSRRDGAPEFLWSRYGTEAPSLQQAERALKT